MAMTEASLLARLKAALGEAETPEGVAIQDDVLGKIAGAIIEEIQANAVVTIPLGVPVATTGTAAAQTGATTAPAIGTVA
jgi:hypothetical protein